MSIRVMADVWDFGPEDPIDNSVLLWLANRCNDQGGSCFPSIAEISQKTRRSERTVSRSIAQLETDGWLFVERGSGKGKVSQYVVNVAKLKGRQPDTLSKHTQEPKGDSGDDQKVTPTTPKGDSGDKPPHPLIGVTVNEPPVEPPTPQPAASVAEQEEAIYQMYPRRTGRGAAIKAIQKAVERLTKGSVTTPPILPLAARRYLYSKTKAYAASPAGRDSPGEDYRPHPATWFNQERYDDDPVLWQKTNGGVNGISRTQSKQNASIAAGQAVIARLRGMDHDGTGKDSGADGGGDQPRALRHDNR